MHRGKVKLATLRVTEMMGGRKAKATREHNAAVTRNAGGKSREPPAKKPRMLEENAGTEEIGATEHVVRMAVAAATAQEEPDRETGATALGAELFPHDSTSDHALIEWLRARETQPRCGILLQQICEWGGKNQAAMRALAVAQGINVSRRSRGTSELLLEEVRKHFRAAISQEKGRLATFDFHIARGASEHLVPAAAEAEQWIQAADVIDLATLKRYRRQYKDLPS